MFSVEEENDHKVYKILGLKVKIRDYKESINQAKKDSIRIAKNESIKIFTSFGRNLLSNDDKIRFLSQKFYKYVGYYPNFKKPRSFNEKLNWLRFNYKYTGIGKRCDKASFKQYIAEKLGADYTIKLLKVFDDVADLNFDGLPDKFVVKTTLGFGASAVKIIKDKSKADLNEIKYDLSVAMNPWEYAIGDGLFRTKNPKQKVIVEEYREQKDGQLYDFKFLCFHGEPKIIIAIRDRKNGNYSISYYDTEWNKLPMKKANHKNRDVEKPKNLDEMLDVARTLSEDIPFVRVDLYNIDGQIYTGEMTFIPAGAMSKFEPIEWDYKMGEWLDLSKLNPDNLKIMPEFAEAAKTFIDPEIVDKHIVV